MQASNRVPGAGAFPRPVQQSVQSPPPHAFQWRLAQEKHNPGLQPFCPESTCDTVRPTAGVTKGKRVRCVFPLVRVPTDDACVRPIDNAVMLCPAHATGLPALFAHSPTQVARSGLCQWPARDLSSAIKPGRGPQCGLQCATAGANLPALMALNPMTSQPSNPEMCDVRVERGRWHFQGIASSTEPLAA